MRRRRRRRAAPARAGASAGIAVGAGAMLVGLAAALFIFRGDVEDTIRSVTLPLNHEDIIRQQARDKDVPADLIAAVIYSESRFRDQTSSAGARGLMQITPQTAQIIEQKSGGSTFTLEDLSDPDVNIRYGTFYLHYLLEPFRRQRGRGDRRLQRGGDRGRGVGRRRSDRERHPVRRDPRLRRQRAQQARRLPQELPQRAGSLVARRAPHPDHHQELERQPGPEHPGLDLVGVEAADLLGLDRHVDVGGEDRGEQAEQPPARERAAALVENGQAAGDLGDPEIETASFGGTGLCGGTVAS